MAFFVILVCRHRKEGGLISVMLLWKINVLTFSLILKPNNILVHCLGRLLNEESIGSVVSYKITKIINDFRNFCRNNYRLYFFSVLKFWLINNFEKLLSNL